MNRKFEDELLKLAFEETTPEQAMVMELAAQQDPEAAQALSQYRQMRLGLRELAEVPADQLSKERLREAILTRGLKPRRGFNLGWVAMPAMAAALAVVFLAYRPHPAVTPQVVASRGVNPFRMATITPPSPLAMVTPTHDIDSNPAKTVAPRPSAATMVALRHVVRHHGKHVPEALDAKVKDGIFDPEFDGSRFAMIASVSHSENVLPSPSVSAAVPAPNPIVLIDSQKDGNTGAARATEVDSSSNVVVGG